VVVDGSEEEQLHRRRWHVREPAGHGPLDPGRHRQRVVRRFGRVGRAGLDRGRQFDEREWVASRFPEDSLANRRPEVGAIALEELARVGFLQRPDRDDLQSGRLDRRRRLALTQREKERHGIRAEPPADERQRFVRRPIEPVRVIDHGEDRLLRRGIRQERQRREGDQERILNGAIGEPERRPQCRPLGRRERLEPAEERPQQLMESGEG
jgi:hypothetical protein